LSTALIGISWRAKKLSILSGEAEIAAHLENSSFCAYVPIGRFPLGALYVAQSYCLFGLGQIA
jgi:hypothetical protein